MAVIIICMITGLIFFSPQEVVAQSASELFAQANQSYEQRQYDQAIGLYEQLIEQDITNPTIYYNLGNAYFKKGNVARAVLNYEKARKMAPRDHDIKENLDYALAQTADKIEDPHNSILTTIVGYVHDYLTLDEWTIIVVILFNLACLVIAVRMMLSSSILRDLALYNLVLLLCLLFVSLAFLSVKINTTFFTEQGVIMVSQVDVRSGPATTYTTLLKVHAGTRADIVQSSNDWLQIKLENGYQGWIPQAMIEKI